MADTMVLGAIASACRFKSCCPHHKVATKKMQPPKTSVIPRFFAVYRVIFGQTVL